VFFPQQAPPFLETLRILWASYIHIFVLSLVLTLLLTPIFRAVAMRKGIYDMPDSHLKPHGQPIPYLGGMAIYIAVALCLVATAILGQVEQQTAIWPLLLGATVIFAVGLIDDIYDIKPKYKILAQIFAALILVAGGIIFRAIPYGTDGIRWLSPESKTLLAAGIIFEIVLVVGACNATNLLDGLDGLCSGVTAIIAAGFLLLATSIAGWARFGEAPHYQFAELIMLLSMAICGAALGFLPYNFNPASIFMGDAGSMLLGYLCAALMIMFAERPGMLKWFLGAMVIFGLPIFDTGLALVRRWVNRRPIFAGDRSHFYDQLVDRGFSVKQTVAICYGLAVLFSALGVAIIFIRTRYALLVYLTVFAAIAAAVVKLGMVKVDQSDAPSA